MENQTIDLKQYSIKTPMNTVQVFTDPHHAGLQIIHAYVPVRNFPTGQISDEVNPRSHEKISARLATAIEESLKESPTDFHLLNRGILILADKAFYDAKNEILHFDCKSNETGLADGATTDRVLARLKATIPEFDKLREEELPEFFQTASVHLEIISGDIGDMLVPLADARNTSLQVKEFALENLGGGFDWLKEILEESEFKDRIRYRENDPQPVDVRQILGLLTLFNPKWIDEKQEPIMAYTNKGQVLDKFRDEAWQVGYQSLKPLAADILRLYDHIHKTFPAQYAKLDAKKLSVRKEVKFKEKGNYVLPLTQAKTHYKIPDGWLYPILAAFRKLVKFENGTASWWSDPFQFFDEIGGSMVADVVEANDSMGHKPGVVGQARSLWNGLRKSVELRRQNLLGGGMEMVPEKSTMRTKKTKSVSAAA